MEALTLRELVKKRIRILEFYAVAYNNEQDWCLKEGKPKPHYHDARKRFLKNMALLSWYYDMLRDLDEGLAYCHGLGWHHCEIDEEFV